MLYRIWEFRQQINCWVPLTDVSPFFSHRNVMMRLNLQLTMGTFSVSLFGLIGVAFGMNLESSLEEVGNKSCIYHKMWVLHLQLISYLVQFHSFHRQSSRDSCVHTVTSFVSKLLHGKRHNIYCSLFSMSCPWKRNGRRIFGCISSWL